MCEHGRKRGCVMRDSSPPPKKTASADGGVDRRSPDVDLDVITAETAVSKVSKVLSFSDVSMQHYSQDAGVTVESSTKVLSLPDVSPRRHSQAFGVTVESLTKVLSFADVSSGHPSSTPGRAAKQPKPHVIKQYIPVSKTASSGTPMVHRVDTEASSATAATQQSSSTSSVMSRSVSSPAISSCSLNNINFNTIDASTINISNHNDIITKNVEECVDENATAVSNLTSTEQFIQSLVPVQTELCQTRSGTLDLEFIPPVSSSAQTDPVISVAEQVVISTTDNSTPVFSGEFDLAQAWFKC